MLFQNVQNLFRVSGFIARVERQINHLFLGVPDIDRIILAQRARRRVADRRLPLRTEAEAPRPGRHRRRGEHHRQHRAERQHGPQRQQNPRIFPAEPFDLFHNQAPPPQPMRRLPFLGRFFRCAAFCRRFAENGRVLQTKSAHPLHVFAKIYKSAETAFAKLLILWYDRRAVCFSIVKRERSKEKKRKGKREREKKERKTWKTSEARGGAIWGS